LREIRKLTDTVLRSLSAEFDRLYSASGRPSIAPEYVLRALLLQAFYSVRSERQLVEQLDYNLLFRWFVGLGIRTGHLDIVAESFNLLNHSNISLLNTAFGPGTAAQPGFGQPVGASTARRLQFSLDYEF
jgi:hypothetical protein